MKPIDAPALLAEADTILTPPAPSSSGHQPPAHPAPSSADSGACGGVAPGDGPGFTLPKPSRFQISDGRHRLVGRVAEPAESEAEVLARLMAAARPVMPGTQAVADQINASVRAGRNS